MINKLNNTFNQNGIAENNAARLFPAANKIDMEGFL